jgi:hypothetical protein
MVAVMNEHGGREAYHLGLADTRQGVGLTIERKGIINPRSRLAQLVERVTSNDEVSRSSRLMGIFLLSYYSIPIYQF